MGKLILKLAYILIDIRRNLLFPWSVLGYDLREKTRFRYKLIFLKTFYYLWFYIKYIVLSILLWPYFIRRIKCSKKSQAYFTDLFHLSCTLWFLGIAIAYILMLSTKWFEIFIFFPFMRIVYLILFEVKYRKNKKLLFKESTRQELFDFKGDNMHRPEKSLLTYKESYRYGSTYKKFTIPVFCSSPAIDLNYELFEIDKITTYEKAKEKIIELLSNEFFDLLENSNPCRLEKISSDNYFFKNEISIIYTLVKRLDYNCIFLYFIPHFLEYMLSKKDIYPWLSEAVNKLMRNYLEKGVYIINPIFKQEKVLQVYKKYVVEKDDEVKDDFIKEIFYYDLFFSNLKKKYYFHSSDGKIDFTHPFLPIFFFRSWYIEEKQKEWSEWFPEVKGTAISDYDVLYPWLADCY